MHRLVTDNKAQLDRLCRQHSVRRLYLFGSAAEASANPDIHDLDFLVEFEPGTPAEHYERYFGLLEALRELFGCPIDLVEPEALRNPVFIRQVNQTRVPLYAA
ncbi:MAG: hypothetical protein BIFFINMI_03107 [Phycisphaerae bacterium]|nr:hypothetical protein [Phycisphaerae bacterium]